MDSIENETFNSSAELAEFFGVSQCEFMKMWSYLPSEDRNYYRTTPLDVIDSVR